MTNLTSKREFLNRISTDIGSVDPFILNLAYECVENAVGCALYQEGFVDGVISLLENLYGAASDGDLIIVQVTS